MAELLNKTLDHIWKVFREHVLGQEYNHKEIDRHIKNDSIHSPVSFVTPDSITVNTGGIPVGDVTDIQTLLDGNTYNLPEVAGVPGYDLEICFRRIINIKGFVFRAYYSPNNSAHLVTFDMYNYDTVTWDSFMQVPPANGYNYRYIEIPNGSYYFNNRGDARMRFYHISSGNSAHDLYIDYAAIIS